MRDARLIPQLVEHLSEDEWPQLCKAAEDALSRMGAAAETYIIDHWDDLDRYQRRHGQAVLNRPGGPRTVQHLRSRFREARARLAELGDWLSGALAHPDRSLLDLIEREIHRGQPEMDRAFATLCILLGEERPGLDGARKRMEARRCSRARTEGPPSVSLFGGPTVNLAVECLACGDENACDFGLVLYCRRSGVRLDPTVPCPSCGRQGSPVPTGRSDFALSMEIHHIIRRFREQPGNDASDLPPPHGILRFVEDPPEPPEPPQVPRVKVGHNAPCPCGSGRKYKKCCLLKERHTL